MSFSPRQFAVTLEVDHPNLLSGLEALLQLDLISDDQLRQLGRLQLSCVLPEIAVATSPAISRTFENDFVTSVPSREAPPRETQSLQRSSFLTRILQSLKAELSVVWLLVLGVFMVVISSAVLAASQWQNFPPVAQYLVLLGYTLSFWGVSVWAGRQENLRLTASTLQIITLLLIPVNFWAIDRFLLQSFQIQLGITAAIAALILSAIAFPLFKSSLLSASATEKTRTLLCYLGLSYLQSGWEVPQFPVIAIYLGAVGLTIAVPKSSQSLSLKLPTLLAFAFTLLLIRAVFIAEVEVAQLGLAFGICGWLVARIAQPLQQSALWRLSGGLLGLGWLVSVEQVPWQALIVSSIGFWLLAQLLQRFWRKLDVIGLLAIALQMGWLIWRLVPSALQTQIIDVSVRFTESQQVPEALLGLFLFPYVVITLALSEWFYQQQKPVLGKFAAAIALVFGILLTGISAFVPFVRTLNLFISTITAAWIARQPRNHHNAPLIYLTHLSGLFTIASAIHTQFPSLNSDDWAAILLAFAVVEWSFSTFASWTIARRSAWHIGFTLAALSYVLLLKTNHSPILETCWLVVPLTLTGIAARDENRRTLAAWMSTIALLAAQVLTVQSIATGFVGLSFAALLMIVNTQFLQRLEAAQITVGLGLALIGWLFWHQVPGVQTGEAWLLIGAGMVAVLWQLRREFQKRASILLYAQASDFWVTLLGAGVLIGSTAHAIALYSNLSSPSFSVWAATAIITAVTAHRLWQTSSDVALLGLGLGLELLVAEGLGWAGHSILALSIANVALGLLVQLVGDFFATARWTNHRQITSSGWHSLPLIYGGFALYLRSPYFEQWTGLISLGASLIAIGVGRRQETFKPLTYLGAIGLSLSAYELLLYRVHLFPLSDQLMAIATLGTVIMAFYRWLLPLRLDYLRLSRAEVNQLAHLHWGVSSGVLSLAAVLTLLEPETPGALALVGFTTGVALSLYAIFQARRHPNLGIAESWLYAGLIEAAALIWYLSTKPWFSGFFNSVLRPYAGTIAPILAFVIFVLPWERLGWEKLPWQRVSLTLPLLVLAGTAAIVSPLSLIVTGVFYCLVASIRQQVRWTYLSLVLLNWLILNQLHRLNVNVLFWQVLPIGLSILYFAQIEPSLQQSSGWMSRHYVRICGTSLICIIALFTQENYGILPGIVSLIVVFAGLGLRVRAFLYVGTVIFLFNIFNQLIILVSIYSFLKWVIGLCLGILLIWIAANFETRREQVTGLMQNWLSQLRSWQ